MAASPADAADAQTPQSGAEAGAEARRGAVAAAVKRPRQSAARKREVQELLDSVGGTTRGVGRGDTIVVGGRHSCAALPQDVHDEIRRNLDTVAKAAKSEKIEVRPCTCCPHHHCQGVVSGN